MRRSPTITALATVFAMTACANPARTPRTSSPAPIASPATDPAPAAAPDREVRTSVLRGIDRPPGPAQTSAAPPRPRPGDISLNFAGADVQAVARAVLGDILGLQYVVAPELRAPITLVTERPVARADVLPLLEEALRVAGLAIVPQGQVYAIVAVDQARAQAQVDDGGLTGFATETITLQFIGAAEFQRLLGPVLPNVVVQTAGAGNAVVIAGTTGQRAAVRDLVRQFDVNWLRNMSFALFVPQRTDSRLIVPELDRLLNSEGAPTRGLVKLIAMEKLNGILAVTGQSQYIDDVRRWVEILDREGENNEARLFVYRVQNGRARDLARVLSGAFGSGGDGAGDDRSDGDATVEPSDEASTSRGNAERRRDPAGERPLPDPQNSTGEAPQAAGGRASSIQIATGAITANITSDETNNAIVVFTTPRDYAVIEDALRKLDILPFQVMVEAAIAEVTLNDTLRYGVQWLFDDLGRVDASLTEGNSAIPTRIFPGFSAVYAKAGSITATLNALENLTKVNVVSAPKLMVLNNQTASLQVGDQVPIATGSAVSVENPDAPIVNAIEYKDTGIILKVTPRVNSSGLVLLDVAQEVSDVVETSSSDIDSPTISTRRVATSIAVQDGQVIALGGLIRLQKTVGRNGLPILSRIPILGGLLFGNTTNRDIKTELVVLLRPRVVRSANESRAVTDELLDKLRGLRPLLGDAPIP